MDENGGLYLVQILHLVPILCFLCPHWRALPLGKLFNVSSDSCDFSSPCSSRFQEHKSPAILTSWYTHLPHLPFRADRNSTEGDFGNCLTRIREKHAESFVGWLPGYVWLCLLWTVVLRRPVSGWHDPLLSRCPAPSTAMETGPAKDPCPALTAECNWQKCLDMPECQKPCC